MNESDEKNDQQFLEELIAGGTKLGTDGKLRLNDGRDLAAVILGRRGGQKGGKARAKALTAEERKSIAKSAAAARWKRNSNG